MRARGVLRPSRTRGPIRPAPETVPWRYIVEASTPEAEARGIVRGSVEIINEDIRRRPASERITT